MRHVILLLAILSLGGCAMFDIVPKQVVQGADTSASLAEINQRNVRAVNDEILRVLKVFIKNHVKDPENSRDAMAEAERLHQRIAAKFYRPADINAQLARAIAEYLKAPGIGFDNIMSILDVVEAKAHGSTN